MADEENEEGAEQPEPTARVLTAEQYSAERREGILGGKMRTGASEREIAATDEAAEYERRNDEKRRLESPMAPRDVAVKVEKGVAVGHPLEPAVEGRVPTEGLAAAANNVIGERAEDPSQAETRDGGNVQRTPGEEAQDTKRSDSPPPGGGDVRPGLTPDDAADAEG